MLNLNSQEITKQGITLHNIKLVRGGCTGLRKEKDLSLGRLISLSQQMLKVFDDKIMGFQRLLIRPR
jgi:hypothetical protein